jgi:hypothetical protein
MVRCTIYDPYGLVRWKDAGKAILGLIGNGLGMIVGGSLVVAPDVTMLTKFAGCVILGKSTVGWGLNWYNLTQAFTQDCKNYDAPSSATRLVASVIAPGNSDALLAADAFDLSLDLVTGRMIFRYPYGVPTIEGVNGITRAFDPIDKMFYYSKQIKAFQSFETGKTVYDDLWQNN